MSFQCDRENMWSFDDYFENANILLANAAKKNQSNEKGAGKVKRRVARKRQRCPYLLRPLKRKAVANYWVSSVFVFTVNLLFF